MHYNQEVWFITAAAYKESMDASFGASSLGQNALFQPIFTRNTKILTAMLMWTKDGPSSAKEAFAPGSSFPASQILPDLGRPLNLDRITKRADAEGPGRLR